MHGKSCKVSSQSNLGPSERSSALSLKVQSDIYSWTYGVAVGSTLRRPQRRISDIRSCKVTRRINRVKMSVWKGAKWALGRLACGKMATPLPDFFCLAYRWVSIFLGMFQGLNWERRLKRNTACQFCRSWSKVQRWLHLVYIFLFCLILLDGSLTKLG